MAAKAWPVIAAGVALAGVAGIAAAASSSKKKLAVVPTPKPQPTRPVPINAQPTNPQAILSPPQAAAALYLLVTSKTEGLNWGTKSQPNSTIAGAQNDMGGVTTDGIYGPATAARGEQLIGKKFPPRGGFPAGTVTIPANQINVEESAAQMVQALQGGGQTMTIAKPAPSQYALDAMQTAPQGFSAPVNATPVRQETTTSAATAAAVPTSATTAPRGARAAAQALLSFAQAAVREGRIADLGTKDNPSELVRACQRDMAGKPKLVTDGIYGAKTRARGKELLGTQFPDTTGKLVVKQLQPAAAAPAAPPSEAVAQIVKGEIPDHFSADAAAAVLYDHLTSAGTNAVAWGSKAKPNALVQRAQSKMGGLTADGIYGAKTKARGEQLLGRTFPNRPA